MMLKNGTFAKDTVNKCGEVMRNEILAAKTWKKILFVVLLTLIVLVAMGAVALVYIISSINKDVVSPIDVINSGGSEKALVVY